MDVELHSKLVLTGFGKTSLLPCSHWLSIYVQQRPFGHLKVKNELRGSRTIRILANWCGDASIISVCYYSQAKTKIGT